MYEKDKADAALLAIPTPHDRDQWYKLLMAYKSAGGDQETARNWSKRGDNYDESAFNSTWRSINPDGGITAGTLYQTARATGWTPTDNAGEYHRAKPTATPKQKQLTTQQRKANAEAISKAGQHRDAIRDYCHGRGLTDETIERFNLGHDAKSNRLVIPYPGTAYYVSRSLTIAPNGDHKDGARKYEYPKGQGKELFNAPALNYGAEVVFIVEGQIDAISLEQDGAAAVAATEPGTVLDAIREQGTTAGAFVVIPDNDEPGADKAEKMHQALSDAGFLVMTQALPAEYHDANDFLIKAPGDLWEFCRETATKATALKTEAAKEYQSTTSAAAFLPLLDAEIAQRREPITTGYPTLDAVLGDAGIIGGLFPGLYILGGTTSIGKTTFCLQMADAIAATGRDVLIISLEMSVVELIAKSISRLTYTTAPADRYRKTTRGILSGDRYQRYGDGDRAAIAEARRHYSQIADHLYIVEVAAGTEYTADAVRRAVERHKNATGRAPVVYLDYLQILSPADPRATDKQNTDRAIVELKRISRDFNIPVLTVSSMNRAAYGKNADTEGIFKESGTIEYSGDVLIRLSYKGDGDGKFSLQEAKSKTPREVELSIIKNRNGALTKSPIAFSFYSMYNYFQDMGAEADAPAPRIRM